MSRESGAPPSAAPDSSAARHDGLVAFRNAFKLAASLIATWSVAFIVTFKLPNYLGDVAFGRYRVAESFAATLFVFIGLGVDTYIQREIPVRPRHGSDFFAGFVSARLLLSVPLFFIGAVLLRHEASEVRVAALLFGFCQIFLTLNETFAKTLQASTHVGGLAIANVVAKLLWGAGVLVAVSMKAPLVVLVLPMLAAETLKAIFLFVATRRAIDLELRIDFAATKAVLRESLPFFVANAAVAFGASLDVAMLGFLRVDKAEIGWYAAARQIANLSMLLSPILSGVLIPMMRRAKERSEAEFDAMLRRTLEGVTVASIPITLLLALGSETWIGLALKPQFAPAAGSLVLLAPTFVFAYGNVLLWLGLMILGRSWTITVISIAGLIALPVFVWVALLFAQGGAPGAIGMATAAALSLRELAIILVFLAFLGRRAVDGRSVSQLVKSVVVCVLVGLAHRSMPYGGLLRLVFDGALYAVLALVVRIVRPSDLVLVLRLVRDRKKAA